MTARPTSEHPLVGRMFLCTASEIESVLMWEKATPQQLVLLALEELHSGHDRADVYRILAKYKS